MMQIYVERRHLYLSVGKGIDDHSKSRERLIDLLGLLQSLTRCSSLADLLGTSKIDKIEVTSLLRTSLRVLLVDGNEKDGM